MEDRNPASRRRRGRPGEDSAVSDTPEVRAVRPASKFRILVANEPRSYREAIYGTLQLLRPDVEVSIVDPRNLDVEVGLASPDMVVCSCATRAVKKKVPLWIELHPEGRSLSTISIGKNPFTLGDVQLTDLTLFIDYGAGFLRTG